MQSIAIIKSEHRNLTSVLYTLKQSVEYHHESDQPVPFKAYHGILYYIISFLDRYHHPKENSHLFPKIMQRQPQAETLVKRLGKEHGTGEKLMDALLRALSAYEFLGESGYTAFKQAVDDYVEFERHHVEQEENELMPIAESVLTDEDWQTIDSAFLDHQDPMFGDQPTAEFEALSRTLLNTIPAPFGLG